uniref:Uncharacterized protein n=1 Tax=Anopheles coluzzii TaxID=1518534 RepID=A0A8W7PWX0_ANOCL
MFEASRLPTYRLRPIQSNAMVLMPPSMPTTGIRPLERASPPLNGTSTIWLPFSSMMNAFSSSMFGMQRPFSHANWDAAHVTLPHSNSSEWSPQSFSWSHRKLSGMHRPDLHWNSFVPHVGSVQRR